MLIPVYKPLGISTHRVAQAMGEWAGEKATHTGSLDPMAEGYVLVLTGKDRFNKTAYSNEKKYYSFEILFGVSTDTQDLLGLVTESENHQLTCQEIEQKLSSVLPSFLGKQQQVQPHFSAQRVNGQSGFDLAKQGISFKSQSNPIEISSLSCQKIFLKNISMLEEEINKKVSLIDGDFRQVEILNKWKKTFKLFKKLNIFELPVAQCEMLCSKRTYVRSVVRDVGKMLQYDATCFGINRK